tara:strand:+ start:3497 stop:5488 length:1992 start_codon:yes stop_codon:yes gene_type:complete
MPDWFSPSELAKLNVPGLPDNLRTVQKLIQNENWWGQTDRRGNPLSRFGKGRGKPREYHFSLFPEVSREWLLTNGHLEKVPAPAEPTPEQPLATSVEAFYRLPGKQQEKARERRDMVLLMEQYNKVHDVETAVIEAGKKFGLARRRAFYFWSITRNIPKQFWLPVLADQPKTMPKQVEVDEDAIQYVRDAWLRPERPSFSASFEWLLEAAEEEGWKVRSGDTVESISLQHKKTIKRRMDDTISSSQLILGRYGEEKLESMYPSIKRDRTIFHALEAVNADGHTWDVRVEWDGEIIRPVMVAIQDLYSNKILAWRLGKSENAALIQLTFSDVFRDWGIPNVAYLDNGRGFSSKWISGQAERRFRFKIKPDDPPGLLKEFGCEPQFTKPYSGQSKPIERAFRDLCDHVAKHPKFAGAYTGNSPQNKPSNYGSKAVPIETFIEVVTKGIALHNARPGRNTDVCRRVDSFDSAFERSYAVSPIRKAAPAQLAMSLLMAESITARQRNGEIEFMGNRYWSPEMINYRGQKMIIRFDPDNLHTELHVFTSDKTYVGAIQPTSVAGFNDVQAAKEHERKRRQFVKAEKSWAKAQRRYTPEELAALLPDDEPISPRPQSKVVRVVKTGQAAAARVLADHPDDDFEFNAALERGLKRAGHLSLVENFNEETD